MPTLFPEPSQPRVPPTRTNPQAWVIAFCDGGARGNPGPAGYGALLQDETGETLAELSEFLGIRTNNVAEYSGLLAVLAWTLEHGYRRLRVVSDSELMVKQIQGRFKVKSPDLQPLFAEARHRIVQLDEFQITHALRHKNKAADRLANAAMDRGMGRGAAGSPSEKSAGFGATSYPQKNHLETTTEPQVLTGFTRNGVVHFLGEARLPDGIFVKIVPESRHKP
ncbi:MAG TPA: ribonuclease HI family protein [Acidobacteriaceae bacterium]|jgi:probable phosphoglycerate mutase|nr:ribonuclease HI family protein [Acidobacteriaceae bacterium]